MTVPAQALAVLPFCNRESKQSLSTWRREYSGTKLAPWKLAGDDERRFLMCPSALPGSVSYAHDTVGPRIPSLRHRMIERRAYANWLARGCPTGTALRDWLDAEKEVDSELEMDRWSYVCGSR